MLTDFHKTVETGLDLHLHYSEMTFKILSMGRSGRGPGSIAFHFFQRNQAQGSMIKHLKID